MYSEWISHFVAKHTPDNEKETLFAKYAPNVTAEFS